MTSEQAHTQLSLQLMEKNIKEKLRARIGKQREVDFRFQDSLVDSNSEDSQA